METISHNLMTEKEFIELKIKYYDINQRPFVARHSPKRRGNVSEKDNT